MPELPEVETVRAGLCEQIKSRSIKKVQVLRPSIIKGVNSYKFVELLTSQTFGTPTRRAKYLLLNLAAGGVLMVHLRMSGRFGIGTTASQTANLKHTRVVFSLDDGTELCYIDPRALGELRYFEDEFALSTYPPIRNLAPEPLSQEFTNRYFKKVLRRLKSNIKALLLDQTKLVSGLGNIYTDEALFAAGINPQCKCNALSPKQMERLHSAIKDVIARSIQLGGTSLRDYLSLWGGVGNYKQELKVYGQKGTECPTCRSAKIIYMRHAGRGTHYCPICQPI